MEISVPDPYPGRCKNWRHDRGRAARCIDYDGSPHTCSFPDFAVPLEALAKTGGWSQPIATTHPEPWVKPGTGEYREINDNDGAVMGEAQQ